MSTHSNEILGTDSSKDDDETASQTSDRGSNSAAGLENGDDLRTPVLTDTPAPATKRRAGFSVNKTELVLRQLRSKRGATSASLMEATGWQAHSVRGFLSGTVRKKLGLNLASEVGKDGQRRYRIAPAQPVDGAI